jgi:RimJ/RimL family protein N-acetyltransferase
MNSEMAFRIETPRLYLREMSPADAEQAFLLNSDPDVLKYTGDEPFASVEAARTFLEAYDQFRLYGMGRWAVVRKSDEVFLGWCGLKFHPNENEIDLGYRFFKNFWGQGYATEAAKACLDWAFKVKHVSMVIGNAQQENTASCVVLKKMGMREVAKTLASPCDLRFEVTRAEYLAKYK